MLALTAPLRTPFHRLPAGVKLAALAAVTVGLFRLDSPLSLGVALAGIGALHLVGGPRLLLHAVRLLRPLLPFAAILVLWHLWTRDIHGGLVILLRLIAAMAVANLVTMTTRLSDMIGVLERLAAPLAPIGLPPRTLALAIALAIRFLPVLTERLALLSDAWRARSHRAPGWRILPAAALATLDDADHVAEALRARGGPG